MSKGELVQSRALVVDDNHDVEDTFALALRAFGLDARSLTDPCQAFDVIAEFDPGLLVLDLGMPGLIGHDIARRLRAAPGRERVLGAVTGWGRPQDLRRSAEAGFDHHLVKPPDLAVLKRICAAIAPGSMGIGDDGQ